MRSIKLDEAQAELVPALMQREMDDCRTCKAWGNQGPRHFSGFTGSEGLVFYNNGCESHGRQLAPDLTFTGHPHCSCDTCF